MILKDLEIDPIGVDEGEFEQARSASSHSWFHRFARVIDALTLEVAATPSTNFLGLKGR